MNSFIKFFLSVFTLFSVIALGLGYFLYSSQGQDLTKIDDFVSPIVEAINRLQYDCVYVVSGTDHTSMTAYKVAIMTSLGCDLTVTNTTDVNYLFFPALGVMDDNTEHMGMKATERKVITLILTICYYTLFFVFYGIYLMLFDVITILFYFVVHPLEFLCSILGICILLIFLVVFSLDRLANNHGRSVSFRKGDLPLVSECDYLFPSQSILDGSLFLQLCDKYSVTVGGHGVNDYVIILNKAKVVDPQNSKLMLVLTGTGCKSYDGAFSVTINSHLTVKLVESTLCYNVYQYGNTLVTDDLLLRARSLLNVINPFTWGILFFNSLQRLFLSSVDMDYSMDINGYSAKAYPFLESGIKIWCDPSRTISFLRDYTLCHTTCVAMNAMHSCLVQARGSLLEDRVASRITAAIAVVEATNEVKFNVTESLAIQSVYVREFQHYQALSESQKGIVHLRHHRILWFYMPNIIQNTLEWLYTKRYIKRITKLCLRTPEVPFRPSKPSARCTVHGPECDINDRQYWYTYSDCANHHVLWPKSCLCNAVKAVKNRQIAHLSLYNPRVAIAFLRWVKTNINHLVDIKNYTSMSKESWWESLPSGKKRMAKSAQDANSNGGLLSNKELRIEALMKPELLNLKQRTEVIHRQDPRCVSQRDPRYSVMGGPRIKRISKMLAEIWNFVPKWLSWAVRVTGITYFSTGLNKVTVGQWMDKMLLLGNPIFYNTDYERFDASTSAYLLTVEALVYEMLNPGDHDFIDWLNWQLTTDGVIHVKSSKDHAQMDKVVYFCEGTRKSGDQNTSVGNTILNVLVQCYALSCQRVPITGLRLFPDQPGLDGVIHALRSGGLHILALGDDTAICMDNRVLDELSYVTVIRGLGLIIGLEAKNNHTLTFCSSYFIPAVVDGQETHILTQKLGRNLSRAYGTDKQYNYQQGVSWVKSVAYAYMHDYEHVPMMYAWHRYKYDQNTKAKAMKLDIDRDFTQRHLSSSYSIAPSRRLGAWFTSVYGNALDQRTVVAQTACMNKTWVNWQSPTLETIFDVDVYGVQNFIRVPTVLTPLQITNAIGRSGVITFPGHKAIGVMSDHNVALDVEMLVIPKAFLDFSKITITYDDTKVAVPAVIPLGAAVDLFAVNTPSKPYSFIKMCIDGILAIPTIRFDFEAPPALLELMGAFPLVVDNVLNKARTFRHPIARGERQYMLTLLTTLGYEGNAPLSFYSARESVHNLFLRILQLNGGYGYDVSFMKKLEDVNPRVNTMLMVDQLWDFTPQSLLAYMIANNLTTVTSLHARFDAQQGSLYGGELVWVPINSEDLNSDISIDVKDSVNNVDTVTHYTHSTLEAFYGANTWSCLTDRRSMYSQCIHKGVGYDLFVFKLR